MMGVGGMIAGIVGFIIVLIAVFIAVFICNLRAYSYMLRGCTEITGGDLAEKIDDTRRGFEKSLKGATIAGIIATIFMWVPILNIILFLIYLGFAIWYFVMRIMVIIRIWQTYQKI